MAQSFVQLATDGAGKKIDTSITAIAAQHRQVMSIGDPSVDAQVANVDTAGNLKAVKDLVTGRALVMKTGTLVTTAVTADQVILTYTVTAGKTLYLENISLVARLTVLSATASIMGAASLETPSGTKVFTITWTNPTTSLVQPFGETFPEPLPIAAGTVIRFVVTPAAATSMTWIVNLAGYEK